MGYTTFGKMLNWISSPAGKTVGENRDELVATANDIRQHMYLLYETTPLFLDQTECFCLQEYCLDCDNCADSYVGFTLPRSMQTPEAAWINRTPVRLYSKWREYKTGLSFHDSCKMGIYEVGDDFPTELDIKCGCPDHLKFKASSECDVGNSLIITGKDASGQRIEEIIELGFEFTATDNQFSSIDRNGIVFSTEIKGGVVVAEKSGRVISEYGPGEHVPSYRRFKVPGCKPGDHVNIRASSRFTELFFDTDVVETDNKLAIVDLAYYFRYKSSSSQESKILAAQHAADARKYLLGGKSRDLGKATISEFTFNPMGKRRSGLRRKRR